MYTLYDYFKLKPQMKMCHFMHKISTFQSEGIINLKPTIAVRPTSRQSCRSALSVSEVASGLQTQIQVSVILIYEWVIPGNWCLFHFSIGAFSTICNIKQV